MKFVSPLAFAICFLFSCSDAAQKPVVKNSIPSKPAGNAPLTNLTSSIAAPDLSPMDIAYFPEDYPVLKMSQAAEELPVARVIYSRPHKQNRKIFGALIPYNETWRLGANESTEIEFFRPVTIQGQRINTGRYIMYCVPTETKWTIVFNNNIYSWGLRQDAARDVFRFDIPVQKTESSYEYLTMNFEKAKNGVNLTISWDDVTARLPISM
jgi:hypothetical protein